MKYYIFICLFIFGCAKSQLPQQGASLKTTISPATFPRVHHAINDSDYLQLVRFLPFEATISDVQEYFPTLSLEHAQIYDTNKAIVTARYIISAIIWKIPARITFYFTNNALIFYNIYFDSLNTDQSQNLYNELCSFYKERYGSYSEQPDNDEYGPIYCATWWNNVYFRFYVRFESGGKTVDITFEPSYRRQ
jgi:hypothetical protein